MSDKKFSKKQVMALVSSATLFVLTVIITLSLPIESPVQDVLIPPLAFAVMSLGYFGYTGSIKKTIQYTVWTVVIGVLILIGARG